MEERRNLAIMDSNASANRFSKIAQTIQDSNSDRANQAHYHNESTVKASHHILSSGSVEKRKHESTMGSRYDTNTSVMLNDVSITSPTTGAPLPVQTQSSTAVNSKASGV